MKSPEPLEAMEAWKRRKNYDPLAAAGRKREQLVRKNSAGSSQGTRPSPRAETTPPARQSGSAPSSAKSRSSESSGYLSQRGEKPKRSGLL